MPEQTGEDETVGAGRQPVAVTVADTSVPVGIIDTLPTGSCSGKPASKQQHRDIDGCRP